jgi:hypothetical protein
MCYGLNYREDQALKHGVKIEALESYPLKERTRFEKQPAYNSVIRTSAEGEMAIKIGARKVNAYELMKFLRDNVHPLSLSADDYVAVRNTLTDLEFNHEGEAHVTILVRYPEHYMEKGKEHYT